MKHLVRTKSGSAAASIAAALLFCAAVSSSSAQPVPRIKAKVVSFDGQAMVLDPLSSASVASGAPQLRLTAAPSADGPLTVKVLPQTRYAVTVPAELTDIHAGDYAGAAVTGADGKLTAQEVFLYPPGLAGTGEGRFADNGRTMINGKVTAVSASGFTLAYRGGAEAGGVCMGRADPPAIAGPLDCTGNAVIAVPDAAAVMALSLGNAGMIAPGAMVTVSLARNPQGDYVTPGVVIQGAVENPPPAP